MSTPDWRTSLVVEGMDLSGTRTRVITGLLKTEAGALQLALQVGEFGPTVMLTLQAARDHVIHVQDMLIERLQLALGDDSQ